MELLKEVLDLLMRFIALIVLAKVVYNNWKYDEQPTLYEVLIILVLMY